MQNWAEFGVVRGFCLLITVVIGVLLSACSGTAQGNLVSSAVGSPLAELASQTPASLSESSPTSSVTTLNPSPSISVTQPVSSYTASAVRPTPVSTPVSTATPTAIPRPRTSKRLLGYYVPYDPTSWATLEAQANYIDYVAAQWVTIDSCGNISSKDDRTLINFAQAKGIKVLPSLLTSSEELNHKILADDDVSDQAVRQIVDYVVTEGYDGFDLDFEGVAPADRSMLSAFAAKLSQALHKKGKLFSMALPAKISDTTTGWGGAFEYSALAPSIDFATIMSYAYTLGTTPPGSTAPQSWVDKVAAFATSQIPKEKVLLGVALYGYDWDTTTGERARSLNYSQALAISQKYKIKITTDAATRSATFSYQAKPGDQPPPDEKLPALNHQITTRAAPPCPVATPTLPPSPTPVPGPTERPKPTPTAPSFYQHVIWVEDAESVNSRLSIADKYGIGGVGTWRLGQEDPATWPIITKWRGN